MAYAAWLDIDPIPPYYETPAEGTMFLGRALSK